MDYAAKIDEFEDRHPGTICLVIKPREWAHTVEVLYSSWPKFHGAIWESGVGSDLVHTIMKNVAARTSTPLNLATIKTFHCTDIDKDVVVVGGDGIETWVEERTWTGPDPDTYILVDVKQVKPAPDPDWEVLECSDIPGCVGSILTNAYHQNAVVNMVQNALGCEHKDLAVKVLVSNWETGEHQLQVYGPAVTAYLSVLPRSGNVTKDEVKDAMDEMRDKAIDKANDHLGVPRSPRIETTLFPPKAILATTPKMDAMIANVVVGEERKQWVHKDATDTDDVPAIAPPWSAPKTPRSPIMQAYDAAGGTGGFVKSAEVTLEEMARAYGASDGQIAAMDFAKVEERIMGVATEDISAGMVIEMVDGKISRAASGKITATDYGYSGGHQQAMDDEEKVPVSNAQKRRQEMFAKQREEYTENPLERAFTRSMDPNFDPFGGYTEDVARSQRSICDDIPTSAEVVDEPEFPTIESLLKAILAELQIANMGD